MFKKINFLLLLAVTSLVFTSCDKDEPEITDPEELITTVRMTFTPSNFTGDTVQIQFQDVDGDGGGAPVITGGTLRANSIYTSSVQFFNESIDPLDDVTLEIQEEDEEHQVFYSSTVVGVSVSYGDQDENSRPVGLSTSTVTGDAGTGNMNITLIHEPIKDGENVSTGDLTNAGGEIDIEVSIPINVE